MLDPTELLRLARQLSTASGSWASNDAELRRAVSTAYYAVFHTLVGTAAGRFMGPGQQHAAGFSIIYRSFQHRNIKEVCEALQVSTLKAKYQRALSRTSVSQEIRDFASIIPSLQENRHLADYHPTHLFYLSDVSSIIDSAEFAMIAFDQADLDEKTDVLALMMAGARD